MKKKVRWLRKFLLGIIDEVYDLGGSMNEDQVQKLIDDVFKLMAKPK